MSSLFDRTWCLRFVCIMCGVYVCSYEGFDLRILCGKYEFKSLLFTPYIHFSHDPRFLTLTPRPQVAVQGLYGLYGVPKNVNPFPAPLTGAALSLDGQIDFTHACGPSG
jgi:hypothetical protein